MLKKIIKKTIWYVSGGYKPKSFWDRWASTFMLDSWQKKIHPQHTWILHKIKETNPESILEVGCGFGRNINFLIENDINPAIITGVDISPRMIQQAKKYINNSKVRLKTARAEELPFTDSTFDTVMLHGVFMHITPKNIHKAIAECLRVAKKSLIIVEQNYPADNEYTFVHDYKSLFKKLNSEIEEYKKNKKVGLDYIYVKVR